MGSKDYLKGYYYFVTMTKIFNGVNTSFFFTMYVKKKLLFITNR